ncbi:/ / DNA protecting protein DprA / 168017:168778 Forward [Candidatus Hepatoplasma crinochetorum]|uniref:/ / DNA protecting protein DprA / 168017:168778 Forward n=1 Tax=Candidatus Hepatoplasma crinochetorum TaxID=295596 RepID=A0A0G7ZNP0_9MOLU|nr:/ / DNA protecting protein DprA / 168017:168778 Forward [Candidatus Hepatoplasma crinochetorum]
MREILLYFSVKYNGNWDEIYSALKEKESINYSLYKQILNRYKNKNYITIIDNNYPKNLKKIAFPPFVIYYQGNIKLLNQKEIIWLFGAKFLESEKRIFYNLKNQFDQKNIIVVLGQSNPFENAFIRNSNLKKMILVKDSGIDSQIIIDYKIEQKIIENKSLIISEFPDYNLPTKKRWYKSNKIKIGLSNGIFLYNTEKAQDIFNVLSHVILENKKIYCYTESFYKYNLNYELIKYGGIEIKDVGDIVKKWQKI